MIISQTPLRISFVGGGTDLRSFYQHEDGMVLSSAIDKYVYVIVKERFDDKIYINYSVKEIVNDVSGSSISLCGSDEKSGIKKEG
jgi:D-glycero-alpha-D-manno-heptose-7-phosphate kinase